MSRRIVALVLASVMLVSVGAPLALAAPTGPSIASAVNDGSVTAATDQQSMAANNSTSNATPPGQKLAGVIGVQGSETNGEIERRSFDQRFSNANSNASKAAVVAKQLDIARDRLDRLEQQKARLESQYEAGEISDSRYRVQITRLVADIERTESILNQTESAAQTVPESDLRERGVDTTELEDLRTKASNLTGPEVSEIARDLVGDVPGNGRDAESDDEDDANETRGSDNADERESDNRPTDRGSDSNNGADASDRGQQAKDADDTTVTVTTDERSDDGTDSGSETDDETTTTTTTEAPSNSAESGTSD